MNEFQLRSCNNCALVRFSKVTLACQNCGCPDYEIITKGKIEY